MKKKMPAVETVKPLSVQANEKFKKSCNRVAFLLLLLFIGSLWVLVENFYTIEGTFDVLAIAGTVAISGLGSLSAILLSAGRSAGYHKAYKRFLRIFGECPTENCDATQKMVDCVLTGLRLRSEGAAGRVVGAKKKHDIQMSLRSSEELWATRLDLNKARDAYDKAVESALDWHYAIECILVK